MNSLGNIATKSGSVLFYGCTLWTKILHCYIYHLPTEIRLAIHHLLPRANRSSKHPHLKSMWILTTHNKTFVIGSIYIATFCDISIAKAQCDNDDPSIKQLLYLSGQSVHQDERKTVKAHALAGDQWTIVELVGVLGMGISRHLIIWFIRSSCVHVLFVTVRGHTVGWDSSQLCWRSGKMLANPPCFLD